MKNKGYISRVVLIVFSLVFMFGLAYWFYHDDQIEKYEVDIVDNGMHFMDEASVINYLKKEGFLLHGQLKKENIGKLERSLVDNPYVDSAEVFVTKNNTLRIRVHQLEPIARVFLRKNAKSFYLKGNNKLVEVSNKYTARVPVVTGFYKVVKDSVFRTQLCAMLEDIKKDTFWYAQFQEMEVMPNKELKITPSVGDHLIIFGDIQNYQKKLKNLGLFYEEVMNNIGYSAYDVLDIRFENQVIASPQYKNKNQDKS